MLHVEVAQVLLLFFPFLNVESLKKWKPVSIKVLMQSTCEAQSTSFYTDTLSNSHRRVFSSSVHLAFNPRS